MRTEEFEKNIRIFTPFLFITFIKNTQKLTTDSLFELIKLERQVKEDVLCKKDDTDQVDNQYIYLMNTLINSDIEDKERQTNCL